MIAPVKALKKFEVDWLGTNYCKHRHTFLEHYDCFLAESPNTSPLHEKVGFFDIESTGLKADFAYVFSYAIKIAGGKILGRVLRPDEIKNGVFDKNLMKELIDDLSKFHRVVVHYGADRRFDLPFVRTRAIRYRLDFPLYKQIAVSDTWLIAKNKLKLRSNRLGVLCEFFGIAAKEHPMNPDVWMRALTGDKKALNFIWTHNKEDVRSTEALYGLIKDYAALDKRSI
jgi:uncharacterized protein YprB with RNaseH-like and TPR domain